MKKGKKKERLIKIETAFIGYLFVMIAMERIGIMAYGMQPDSTAREVDVSSARYFSYFVKEYHRKLPLTVKVDKASLIKTYTSLANATPVLQHVDPEAMQAENRPAEENAALEQDDIAEENVDEEAEAEAAEATEAAAAEPVTTPEPEAEAQEAPAYDWSNPVEFAPAIQAPELQGTELARGRLRSNTGTLLNLIIDWKAVATGGSEVQVLIEARLESCGIQAVSNPVKVNVDGQEGNIWSPLLNLKGSQLKTSDMGYRVFTINVADGESKQVSIRADWDFNGVYSDVLISTISCTGTAIISR